MADAPSPSRSILVGGLAGFGLSLMVVWLPGLGVALCCAALVSTGVIAVWHRVAVTQMSLPPGVGVRMGAQAGTVAFVASTGVSVVGWWLTGRPNLSAYLRNSGADLEEEMRVPVELAAQALDQPSVVLLTVVVVAVLYTGLGLLGGALGAGVFQRAELPEPPDTSAT